MCAAVKGPTPSLGQPNHYGLESAKPGPHLRIQPKTAFSRFPRVHWADPKGLQRVDLSHCKRAQEWRLFAQSGRTRREAAIAGRENGRRNWAESGRYRQQKAAGYFRQWRYPNRAVHLRTFAHRLLGSSPRAFRPAPHAQASKFGVRKTVELLGLRRIALGRHDVAKSPQTVALLRAEAQPLCKLIGLLAPRLRPLRNRR